MAGMFFAMVAAPVAAQSLGDVARQEALRREQVKKTGKVLTNADLPASAVVAPPGTPAAESGEAAAPLAEKAAEGPAADGEAAKGADKPGAPSKAPTDDEEGWRGRAATVNGALAAARTQVRQLKALSDRLSLESQASNPDIASRATGERSDVRAQIAQAEAKLAAAQADRDALVQEARVAGVPPAWIQ